MFESPFQLSSRPMQKNPDCRIREIFAWGILNPEKFCSLNPELNMGFGTRNVAQENRNPTKDWNPESKFHCHRLESSTWNPESSAWNPESKTFLDFLTWSDSRLIWPSYTAAYTISGMHKKVMVPHLSRTVPIFQWIHTIGDKIVETLYLTRVTSENKRIRTPPLSPPFKVGVFVVFYR